MYGYLVLWYPVTIWYLILSPLLPISTSTWYFYPYLLLLTLALTPGFYPYPWSLVMSCGWSVNFLVVWVVKWVGSCYTGSTLNAPEHSFVIVL